MRLRRRGDPNATFPPGRQPVPRSTDPATEALVRDNAALKATNARLRLDLDAALKDNARLKAVPPDATTRADDAAPPNKAAAAPQPGTTAAEFAEYERLVAEGRQAAAGLMKSGGGDDDTLRYSDGDPLKDRLGRNITLVDVEEVAVALHRIRKVLKARPDLDAGTIILDEGGGDLSNGCDYSFRDSIFVDDDKAHSDLRQLAFELDFVADQLDEAVEG
jgi:hypothetical protein